VETYGTLICLLECNYILHVQSCLIEYTSYGPFATKLLCHTSKVTYLGVKSLLDVGCGRGISTAWFVTHGLDFVQCVEGSHDAVSQSIIPNSEKHVVEHDFSRGPWWPDR